MRLLGKMFHTKRTPSAASCSPPSILAQRQLAAEPLSRHHYTVQSHTGCRARRQPAGVNAGSSVSLAMSDQRCVLKVIRCSPLNSLFRTYSSGRTAAGCSAADLQPTIQILADLKQTYVRSRNAF